MPDFDTLLELSVIPPEVVVELACLSTTHTNGGSRLQPDGTYDNSESCEFIRTAYSKRIRKIMTRVGG